jgi:GT2 family glycosyltransferase
LESVNIDIILPTCGRVEDLEESIYSLSTNMSNGCNCRYIFLLEENDTPTIDFCKNTGKNSIIVLNTEHLPLAKLFSRGLKECSSKYVFFWNDDIFMLSSEWDIELVNTLKTCDFAGLKLTRRGSKTDFSPHTVFGIPYALIGGTTLSFLEEFGFLDFQYNLWYADPDFGLRMLVAGKIQRWMNILVYHKGGPPTPSYPVSANVDEKLFYEKWSPRVKELQEAYSKVKHLWLA